MMPKMHDFRFLQEVGRRIINRREELGLSQSDVATKAKITPQQLSKYELGLSDPPISTLKRITHALGMSVTALLVQCSVMSEQ
jgi:transcriptional regulator with XRE-family HTH domain